MIFKFRIYYFHNSPRSDFDGVHLTVVDNYQGEENDIILLSLVRSNLRNNLGFLKIENRICVALSRARKGLFVIGNFGMLEQERKNNKWKEIVGLARKENMIGKSLLLYYYFALVCTNPI
jgi:superfamily I DNA and/or RNA helicase